MVSISVRSMPRPWAEREGVDQHLGASALDQDVIGLRVGHEIEAVLEARTAAALDAHPEDVVFWLIGDDLRDALGRALGDGDRCGHDMCPFIMSGTAAHIRNRCCT
jgi:hypothetical protein